MASESIASEGDRDGDGVSKPPFRGCVFCYGAEMTYYGVRKLSSRLTSNAD